MSKFDAEYFRVHAWLNYHYGSASKCENEKCKGIKCKRFEWALIHGKEHKKDRTHYRQLCTSCHKLYDVTEEANRNKSKNSFTRGKKSVNCRAVLLNGITEFESVTIASEKTGVLRGAIQNNLKGISKKTSIGVWTYKN